MEESDQGGTNPDGSFGGGTKPQEEQKTKGVWPSTEEVLKTPSWAQILGGQVSDNEVKMFEKDFRLMVPGEGAVAKITGSDYVMREN